MRRGFGFVRELEMSRVVAWRVISRANRIVRFASMGWRERDYALQSGTNNVGIGLLVVPAVAQ